MQLIQSHLSRLSSILINPEDEDASQVILPPSTVENLSDSIISWIIASFSQKPFASGALLSSICSLYISLIPSISARKELSLLSSPSPESRASYPANGTRPHLGAESDFCGHQKPTVVKQQTYPPGLKGSQEEQVRFLLGIFPALSFEAVCACLGSLPTGTWLALGSPLLEKLTGAVLANPCIARHIHEAMPRADPSVRKPPLSLQAGLHELHQHLYNAHLSAIAATSRMFGPSPSKLGIFHGLKYLISSSILSAGAGPIAFESNRALQLFRTFRRLHLPPDRQFMAAILHLVSRDLESSDALHDLVSGDTLGWLWREWTLLRENEPEPVVDDLLLVAFLEIANKATTMRVLKVPPRAPDSQGMPVWVRQAYSIASSRLSPGTRTHVSTSNYVIEGDLPLPNPKRLNRAVAIAAFHLSEYETAFAMVLDQHFPKKDLIAVLYALAVHIEVVEGENPQLARVLANACAEHLPAVCPKMPKSLSTNQAKQLASFIAILIQKGHIKAAEAFLRVPTKLLSFGSATVLHLFNLLSRGSGTNLLHKISHSMPLSKWPDQHLSLFLSSRSKSLSDSVWASVQNRPDFEQKRFLDARLLHHLRHAQLRYSQCLADFEEVVHNRKMEPDARTLTVLLDVHIRAGSGRAALALYHDICGLPNASKDLSVRFLRIAGLPAWSRYRHRGPRSQLTRLGKHLDELVSAGASIDRPSALFLVKQSLRWAELDDDAIWAILNSSISNASKLDWKRDLKPLFKTVKLAFRHRGNHEAAKEVIGVMLRTKREIASSGNAR